MEENAALSRIEKENKRGKNAYVVEATLEYFISIIITGAYLAKITEAIGMSQGLTGILTSFVSLGYVFQFAVLFLAGKRRVKGFVTVLNIVNQACFSIMYLIPLFHVPKIVKHVLFIIFLLTGYMFSNIINAPKTSWFMLFVKNKERGAFTAKKECCSLIGGMIFSYLMSFVIDHFESTGQLNIAFAISAISIFLLCIGHTITLLRAPQRELPVIKEGKVTLIGTCKSVFGNKHVLKVLTVAIFWNIISCTVTSFYGAYMTNSKEKFGLGFSMSFIAIIMIAHSLVRAILSRPMGKLGDKYSFKTMCMVCYGFLGLSFFINIFTTPSNGKVMYTIYYIVNAVALAGINSSIINLLYEEVEPSQRMCAYAVQQSIAGLSGFLCAIIAGVFVDWVQMNKNGKLLGLYAQQWLSIWGVFLAIILVAFIGVCMQPKHKYK